MKKFKVYPQVECPVCTTKFDLKRKDKKFCSKKCQTNSSRISRTVEKSVTQRRICETFESSFSNLSNNFYETPPKFRVEYMERLIQEGRRLMSVRRILLRKATFWSYGERGMLPIQQILYHYCRLVHGMTVREILDVKRNLPDNSYFPFEYFGPDKEPTYTDGTFLKCSENSDNIRMGKIKQKLSTVKPYDWRAIAYSLSTDKEIEAYEARMATWTKITKEYL